MRYGRFPITFSQTHLKHISLINTSYLSTYYKIEVLMSSNYRHIMQTEKSKSNVFNMNKVGIYILHISVRSGALHTSTKR